MPPPSLIKIHNFILKREGEQAAYKWLVATVANQGEKIAAQKKTISSLKSRITRIRNETKSATPRRL
jgi:hypothetical protein